LSEGEKVIFVAVMARTGANSIPTEKFLDLTEKDDHPTNLGELTSIGKHQHHLLGRKLGYDYVGEDKLISSGYVPGEVIVRTTGLNRSVEAAQSFLTGFYQAGSGPTLDHRVIKNAIPPINIGEIDTLLTELRDEPLPGYLRPFDIHTTNENNDYILNPHFVCPSVPKEEESYKGNFQSLYNKHQHFYDELKKKLEIDLSSYKDIKDLSDTIYSIDGNAKKINKNLNKSDQEKIKNISWEIDIDIFSRLDRRRKLMCHHILNELKKNLLNAKEQYKSNKSYTKMSYLQLDYYHFLAFNKLLPMKISDQIPYASILVLKLVKENDEYKLKLLYNGNDCKLDESFDDFIKLIESNTYNNDILFMDACLNYEIYDEEYYKKIAIIMLILLSGVLGVSWYFSLRQGNKKTEGENDDVLVEYLDKPETINESVLAPELERDDNTTLKLAAQQFAMADDNKEDISNPSDEDGSQD